ncbi:MAG TPA: hypothetical protein PLG15_07125 [Candidatus Gastranaerophilaceae bacterium]|nr:hypothetical protein [Candidatus Gastranaerophilaceae bacterium]HPT42139.1 hypothetical protein [Candidatus Gastranaerophilaceae bacterium]
MAVGLDTEHNYLAQYIAKQNQVGSFTSGDKAKVTEVPKAEETKTDTVEISKKDEPKADKKKYSFKTFIADVADAWINFKEITKGIFKGLLVGGVATTFGLFIDKMSSGLKAAGKFKPAEKVAEAAAKKFTIWTAVASKFKNNKDILSCELSVFKKAFAKGSTKGKIVSGLIGAAILTGYIIAARLRANLKTADVDHALHEGHRDK